MRRVLNPGVVPVIVFMAVFSFAARNGMAQREQLELLDAKGAATQTAINIVGQVKNISTSDISGVTVYCDFTGAGGKVVNTEQTNFDKDPLKPNAQAEFKCSTKASPEIKSFGFRFDQIGRASCRERV